MHVLVTGGCGYVGSALVPALQTADEVDRITVFDSFTGGSPATLIGTLDFENMTVIEGDVRRYGAVERATRDVDSVIHLAAITGAADSNLHEEKTFAVNRDGTQNVLNAAEKTGVERVVLASSCNVYGRTTTEEIDEIVTPDPINPYAESKLAAERLLDKADLEGTALRISTAYGFAPGIRFNLVINDFVFRALTDRPLTVYGDGSNWRPFIHVEDIGRAFVHAVCNMDEWSHSIYNVGADTENYRIEDVARVVSDVVGNAVDITYLEDEQPGPSYHVSFDRLAETGFAPKWSLQEGVSDLVSRFVDGPQQPLKARTND